MTEIDVKNKIRVGDSLELMSPRGNTRFILQDMTDLSGKPLAEAPGGGYRVRIPLPVQAAEFALLVRDL